jgi:catechol 2,3-dioxygenase-like lactoylglutathione lyase family enzyme
MSAGYVPFFHVGILVRDIDQAAEDFKALLGLRFEPVRAAPMVTGEVGRFRYSLEGPPYLELVQMTGSGLLAPAHGEGLHHIAFSEPDVPGRCAAFGGEADTVVQGGRRGPGDLHAARRAPRNPGRVPRIADGGRDPGAAPRLYQIVH